MSRSNPKKTNPATKFIEWSGSKGEFYYYDKEKGENILLQMPIYFMVLDELNTVTGYHEEFKNGIFANEIRDFSKEKLNVRVFGKGTLELGLWSKIKDAVKTKGAKFCKSVYALMITKEGTELVNFKFIGSSFGGTEQGGGWINAKFNKEEGGVQVKESVHGVKGATKFQAPVFQRVKVKPEHDQLAMKADVELQKYFDFYFTAPVEEKTEKEIAVEMLDNEFPPSSSAPIEVDNDNPNPYEVDDLPF